MDGNALVMVIHNIFHDGGETNPGNGRKVAYLQTNIRGATVQLNADRPYSDMSHISENGYNCSWEIRGNSIFFTIHNLEHIQKESSTGRSWLVAHKQVIGPENLHIKISAYIPKWA